jgi:hypothetical protein
MPTEIFENIQRRAKANGVSFSAMAVKLLECGLLDYEDSERVDSNKEGVDA